MTTKLHDAMEVTPAVAFKSYWQGTAFTVVSNLILAQAHGLSAKPTLVRAVLVNQTTELNYNVGDEVSLPLGITSGTGAVIADATNVTTILDGTPSVPNKTTGSMTAITPANWQVVMRAWL
jgi:hypothetical protein